MGALSGFPEKPSFLPLTAPSVREPGMTIHTIIGGLRWTKTT